VEIREVTGDVENEFFGQFYKGDPSGPVAVPEPSTLMLVGLGVVSLLAHGCRRRKRTKTASQGTPP
jgi:hypothetical protein